MGFEYSLLLFLFSIELVVIHTQGETTHKTNDRTPLNISAIYTDVEKAHVQYLHPLVEMFLINFIQLMD